MTAPPPLADRLLRRYQRLFGVNHPEGEKLAALHAGPDRDAYLRGYFDHEFAKGGRILDRFRAIAPGWEGGRGLDFGCGGGGLTYRLREHCSHATGIDLDPQKIAFAAAQADRLGVTGIDFVQYDGGPVPLPAASFDVVMCCDVIEHLPDPARFVADFRRLLKPGGWLLLSFGPPWYHPHGKHMWVKLPGWWTHLLFPRPAVMRAAGADSTATWADLGLQRLSVGKFERVMRASGFRAVYQRHSIMRPLTPLKWVPGVREFFIGETVGVYRNPG